MSTSVLLLGGYFALLSLVWGSLIWGSQRWGEKWRIKRPPLGADPKHPILVSVCIPARDEAANIGACVKAALASRWPNLEVIVVDDRSTDGTTGAAREAGGDDDRLFIVDGSEPPPGWAGKPWACRRAAGEARGQILCFVDADVRLAPDAIAVLVDTMVTEDLRLLSAYGTWELHSFWERTLALMTEASWSSIWPPPTTIVCTPRWPVKWSPTAIFRGTCGPCFPPR